jgi:hypothetical protein
VHLITSLLVLPGTVGMCSLTASLSRARSSTQAPLLQLGGRILPSR